MIFPILIWFVSGYIVLFTILVFMFGEITVSRSTKRNGFLTINDCVIFFYLYYLTF